MTTFHSDAAGHRAHDLTSRSPQRNGRGLYRVVTFLTLFALLFGGFVLMAPISASAQSTATTTAYLNLRAGRSTSTAIITVMPYGATVNVNGGAESGFYPVSYGQYSGYASADYLSIGGSSSGNATNGATGTAYVVDGSLNVRSGPGLSYAVLTVMPNGAAVTLTGESGNGFLGVVYNGTSGFASADYLSTSGSGSAPAPAPAPDSGSVAVGDTVVDSGYVSTSALNVRSGPGTNYGVITVMYSGASVEIMGDPQGGFYPLRYNGTKGWASGDYLTIGSSAPVAPAPGGSTSDIMAIIYAAADRYGQSREDMLRVARCESVLDPNAVNPYSNASGLFQFLPSTWATTPYANQDIFDPVANANAAGWMWSVGRRNEWVCQ